MKYFKETVVGSGTNDQGEYYIGFSEPLKAPWPFFVEDVVAAKRTATSETAADSVFMSGAGGWPATAPQQSLTLELPRVLKIIGFVTGVAAAPEKAVSKVRLAYGTASPDDIVFIVDDAKEFQLSPKNQELHFFDTVIEEARYVRFFPTACANNAYSAECTLKVALLISVASQPNVHLKAVSVAGQHYRGFEHEGGGVTSLNVVTRIREACRKRGGQPPTPQTEVDFQAMLAEMAARSNMNEAYILGQHMDGSWVWDDGTSMTGVDDAIKPHWVTTPLTPDSGICYLHRTEKKIKCDPPSSLVPSRGFLCQFPASAIGFNAAVATGSAEAGGAWATIKAKFSGGAPTFPPEVAPPVAGPAPLGASVAAWQDSGVTSTDVRMNVYPDNLKIFGAVTFGGDSRFLAPTPGLYLVSFVVHGHKLTGEGSVPFATKVGLFKNNILDNAYVVASARTTETVADAFPHSAMALVHMEQKDTLELRTITGIEVVAPSSTTQSNYLSGARIHSDYAFHATWSDGGWEPADDISFSYTSGQVVPFPHALVNVGGAFKHHGNCACTTEQCKCKKFQQKSTFTAPADGAYFFAFSVALWQQWKCDASNTQAAQKQGNPRFCGQHEVVWSPTGGRVIFFLQHHMSMVFIKRFIKTT